MSESTEYLVKNITKTFEIYNAISKMQMEVLSKFDKNIRKSYSSWLSSNWIVTENENLYEDYCLNIIRKEWSYQNEKQDIKSYIWTYLYLYGDDPIWKFFGLPDVEGKTR